MTARSASVSRSGTTSIAGELATWSSLRTWPTSLVGADQSHSAGGATSGTGTDLVVVLDRRSVGILWETGRLIERGLDRGEFVFGHDAVSGHGARHIRANLLNSKHLESRRRVTSRMTSL
jgi:hypothetical protein